MKETLNKNGIPYYIQLKEILIKKIENGEFKDDVIWSENVISKKFKITKPTVRQAFSELERMGLIYKVQGLGTFIKKPVLQLDISKYLSIGRAIDSALAGQDRREEIKILESKVINYDKNLFEGFEVRNPGQKLLNIKRLRILENEPIVYEDSFLNNDICGSISENINENLVYYDFYIDKLHLIPKNIDEYIEPKKLNKEETKILKEEKENMGFLITRIVHDSHDRCIELCKILIKGDKCRYHIKLK